jgi:MFS family permease
VAFAGPAGHPVGDPDDADGRPADQRGVPAIQAVFGVSEHRAGLFITLYALPGILLAPVIGALADRVGRRYVLSGALTIFGLAGTAIAFTNEFTVALGLRVLQGFAAGSILAALAMTVVGDRYAGRQHDAVMGVTSAVLSLGTAAYPLVGGYLAARAWNAPFLMYTATLPVAGFVFVALEDPPTQPTRDNHGYLRAVIRHVPVRRALALYGVMFASFALLFGGLYTTLPFYLTSRFGYAPMTVGLITSGVLLVTAVVSIQHGALTGHTSQATRLAGGFGLYAVGLGVVGLANAPPVLVGGLLVFGAGSGLVTPTLFAALSTLAPDRVRGGIMSLQTSTIGISQAVGPAAFALLGGAVGYQATLLVGSAGGAVCASALGVLAHRT